MHPAAQVRGDVEGRPEQSYRPGDVHEGLIEADGLDHGRDVGQDLVQLGGHLGIATVPPRQEDGLRAELARPDGRHGGVHPEAPRAA